MSRWKSRLRIVLLISPFALFSAAILVSLVFWVTLNPLFGQIAIGLAVVALILALFVAFLMLGP
jgi:uncharacterized membrane protein